MTRITVPSLILAAIMGRCTVLREMGFIEQGSSYIENKFDSEQQIPSRIQSMLVFLVANKGDRFSHPGMTTKKFNFRDVAPKF